MLPLALPSPNASLTYSRTYLPLQAASSALEESLMQGKQLVARVVYISEVHRRGLAQL